jgi:hypothetical protein
MKKQHERIENLLKLIKENPDLKIVPMVDLDVCSSDDYQQWMGRWGEANIDYYWCDDERIYFKENDFEDLVEEILDSDNNYDGDFEKLSANEKEKMAKKLVEEYEWIKCITINIVSP